MADAWSRGDQSAMEAPRLTIRKPFGTWLLHTGNEVLGTKDKDATARLTKGATKLGSCFSLLSLLSRLHALGSPRFVRGLNRRFLAASASCFSYSASSSSV